MKTGNHSRFYKPKFKERFTIFMFQLFANLFFKKAILGWIVIMHDGKTVDWKCKGNPTDLIRTLEVARPNIINTLSTQHMRN